MTDRSAEELERDAERIRSGIASTAEELKYRMSPGQMVDEVTRYLRDSDSSIALDNMRRQIRDNPMALAMIGAGVAWLMFGGRRGSGSGDEYGSAEIYGGYDRDPARPGTYGGTTGVGYVAGSGDTGTTGSASGLGDRARDAASRAGAAGQDYADRASATGHDYADRASAAGRDYAHRAGEAAEGVTERVREFVHDARDKVRDWGSGAGNRARGFAGSAGDRWQSASDRGRHWAEDSGHYVYDRGRGLVATLEREPFIAGAIGLAIGAALGTMLPKTRIEEENYPEARSQVARGAGRAFDYASDRARHMAQDVYDAGRAAAEREGLVPSGERTLAERVGNVAKAAAGAAAHDAEEEGERARDTARSAASGSGSSGSSAASGGSSSYASSSGSGAGSGGAGAGSSGSAAGSAGSGIPGAGTVKPKTGTDDLTSRAATQTRDPGPGGTGPA